MKKEGFTLVELLSVIMILSIILLLVVPSVLKSYENSKKSVYESMINNICDSAINYIKEMESGIIENKCTTKDGCEIELIELKKKGYINKEIENPLTGDELNNGDKDNSVTIKIEEATSTEYEVYVTIGEDERLCNK